MLYTRKGDEGTTKLFHSKPGIRVTKASMLFEALGTVDELNSNIGFSKVLASKEGLTLGENSYKDILEKIQQNLFSLQAELGGELFYIKEEHIDYLEEIVAKVEEQIPPITSFVVPGGTLSGSYLDVCRTIARRGERLMVKLLDSKEKEMNPLSLKFINRLSSTLYALARYANFKEGEKEANPNYK
jgi:cob(I)alamin adenosyltransferase